MSMEDKPQNWMNFEAGIPFEKNDQPLMLTLTQSNRPLLTFHMDGRVTADPNLKPDEAARKIIALLVETGWLQGWQPIETADKSAPRVLVCFNGDASTACFLKWKTNDRIVSAHASGHNKGLRASYWGDTEEMDDYELAEFGVSPSHWLPIPSV